MISPQSEVTYWGALGGSDSTAAFQQCANWCGSNGQPLVIPDSPLAYLLSAPVELMTTRTLIAPSITPPSNLHFSDCLPVQVMGQGNARMQATAAMPTMFELIYNSALGDLGPFYSQIENVQLDGNGLATSCLKSNWVMHVDIAHCRLVNAQRGFEIFGYGVFRAHHNVVRCLNGFFMSGVNNGGGDSLVHDNDIYLLDPNAIGIYMGFYSGDTTIRDNVFTGENNPASAIGIKMDGTTAPASEHIRHVTVGGNEFYALPVGVQMVGKSSTQKNVFDCRIVGNHTAPNGTFNPGQLVIASDCQEIIIESNFCNGKNFTDVTAAPITLTRCEDSVVRGNIMANGKTAAISLTDCTDCDVSGNKITDFGKLGAGYTMIDIWNSLSRRNQIRRNTIRQTSSSYAQNGIAEHTGADYTFMVDNSIYGCSNPLTKVGTHSVATAGV